jgi:hypothetical protein
VVDDHDGERADAVRVARCAVYLDPLSSVADLPRNRGDFLGAAADGQISSVMARGWSSGALGERPVGHRIDKTAHLASVWDERTRRDPRQRLSHICRRVAK